MYALQDGSHRKADIGHLVGLPSVPKIRVHQGRGLAKRYDEDTFLLSLERHSVRRVGRVRPVGQVRRGRMGNGK